MKKDEPDPLHVIQGENVSPATERNVADPKELPLAQDKANPLFTLPESYLMAKEMESLFEEDIVTHIHGHSEPEAD